MSITLSNICKAYGERRVLRGVTLDIPQGVTCLMGPSGCGTTTLLRILTGLEAPDCGEITGVPARIAMVFQEDRLVDSLTVRANLRLALGAGYDPAGRAAPHSGRAVRRHEAPRCPGPSAAVRCASAGAGRALQRAG